MPEESPPQTKTQKLFFIFLVSAVALSMLFFFNSEREIGKLSFETWSDIGGIAPESADRFIKGSIESVARGHEFSTYKNLRRHDDVEASRYKSRSSKIMGWMNIGDRIKGWGDNPWSKIRQIGVLVLIRSFIVLWAILASSLFVIPAAFEGALKRARKIEGKLFFSGFFEAHWATLLRVGFLLPVVYIFLPFYLPAWIVLAVMIGGFPLIVYAWLSLIPERL